MSTTKQRGFTLIELLVVIAIIGVLASVVLVAINPLTQINRAHDAGRKSDLAEIKSALERYKVVTGTYPVTSGWIYSTESNFLRELVDSGDLKQVPRDPKNACGAGTDPRDFACFTYSYYSSGYCNMGGKGYLLTTRLEADNSTAYSQKAVIIDGSQCSTWSEGPYAGFYLLTNGQ